MTYACSTGLLASARLAQAADRIPNEDAIARSDTAGWILLAAVACIFVIFLLEREGFRRLVLRLEDPRPMGLFRIVFGLCALANVNGLWEHFHFLFTDEGLFLTDVAREVYAHEQFLGFGHGLDGDPLGFLDFEGFLQWLKGPNYSLLLIWSSPLAFWIHWAAFQVAMVLLIFGLGTRWVKWIAWFLFHSIILRNTVFWEGTENVYRTFFFYLALSRCGAAYSLDNVLRCRRLRRAGRLSEPGGEGDGAGAPPSERNPQGLEPVYAPIPFWPRMFVVLQVATIYLYTGVVKNGSVWARGDAFYYALNLDHFWRLPPQLLSSYLGTNLFRINTHVTHWWEVFFHLVVFGLVVRWAMREVLPPPSKLAFWGVRAAWIALGLLSLGLVLYLLPVHYAPPSPRYPSTEVLAAIIAGGWLAAMALIGYVQHRLRVRPFRMRLRGRTIVLDADWALRWFFGRRLWLALGIVFHSHLILLMNIGWFSPGLLSGYVCFLNGTEIAFLGRRIGRRLGRILPGPIARWIPADVRAGRPPIPTADWTLPAYRTDGAVLPGWTVWSAFALALAGVFARVFFELSYYWTLAAILALLVAGALRAKRSGAPDLEIVPPPPRRDPWPELPDRTRTLGRPLAYGPVGRTLIGFLFVYHVTAVAAWLLPDKDSFSTFRTKVHEPFRFWLTRTQTTQGWKMFAPNPPRANLFLQTLVTDADGEVWDLARDVYAEGYKPIPWIWYSREGKMNRRIAGSEGGHGKWYQRWYARYVCRKWELDHGGRRPKRVELVKITYPIPTPEYVREHGPYDPREELRRKGTFTKIFSVECDKEVDGQLPNLIRERHGLPPAEGVRRWDVLRGRKDAWERRKSYRKQIRQAKRSSRAPEAHDAE